MLKFWSNHSREGSVIPEFICIHTVLCTWLKLFVDHLRFSASVMYYGGVLLSASLFQHDEHCGEYMNGKLG